MTEKYLNKIGFYRNSSDLEKRYLKESLIPIFYFYLYLSVSANFTSPGSFLRLALEFIGFVIGTTLSYNASRLFKCPRLSLKLIGCVTCILYAFLAFAALMSATVSEF